MDFNDFDIQYCYEMCCDLREIMDSSAIEYLNAQNKDLKDMALKTFQSSKDSYAYFRDFLDKANLQQTTDYLQSRIDELQQNSDVVATNN